MSQREGDNVPEKEIMSQRTKSNVPKLSDDELSVKPFERPTVVERRKRRRQAIVSLMLQNPLISSENIAERLNANERTIKRDIKELRETGIIERIGGDYGGEWRIIRKSNKE